MSSQRKRLTTWSDCDGGGVIGVDTQVPAYHQGKTGAIGSATGTAGAPTLPIMTGAGGASGIDTTGGSTGCTCALGTGLDKAKMPAWLGLSAFAVSMLFRRRRAA